MRLWQEVEGNKARKCNAAVLARKDREFDVALSGMMARKPNRETNYKHAPGPSSAL